MKKLRVQWKKRKIFMVMGVFIFNLCSQGNVILNGEPL
jgi:hypothetical protein